MAQAGKTALLESLKQIVPASANCIYIRQSAPLGLGHAVLCSRPVVGDRPFFVHLADDLISASPSCLTQMQEVFRREHSSVVAVQTVPESQTDKYGIAAVENFNDGLGEISELVEKPHPDNAPIQPGCRGAVHSYTGCVRPVGKHWQGCRWGNTAYRRYKPAT